MDRSGPAIIGFGNGLPSSPSDMSTPSSDGKLSLPPYIGDTPMSGLTVSPTYTITGPRTGLCDRCLKKREKRGKSHRFELVYSKFQCLGCLLREHKHRVLKELAKERDASGTYLKPTKDSDFKKCCQKCRNHHTLVKEKGHKKADCVANRSHDTLPCMMCQLVEELQVNTRLFMKHISRYNRGHYEDVASKLTIRANSWHPSTCFSQDSNTPPSVRSSKMSKRKSEGKRAPEPTLLSLGFHNPSFESVLAACTQPQPTIPSINLFSQKSNKIQENYWRYQNNALNPDRLFPKTIHPLQPNGHILGPMFPSHAPLPMNIRWPFNHLGGFLTPPPNFGNIPKTGTHLDITAVEKCESKPEATESECSDTNSSSKTNKADDSSANEYHRVQEGNVSKEAEPKITLQEQSLKIHHELQETIDCMEVDDEVQTRTTRENQQKQQQKQQLHLQQQLEATQQRQLQQILHDHEASNQMQCDAQQLQQQTPLEKQPVQKVQQRIQHVAPTAVHTTQLGLPLIQAEEYMQQQQQQHQQQQQQQQQHQQLRQQTPVPDIQKLGYDVASTLMMENNMQMQPLMGCMSCVSECGLFCPYWIFAELHLRREILLQSMARGSHNPLAPSIDPSSLFPHNFCLPSRNVGESQAALPIDTRAVDRVKQLFPDAIMPWNLTTTHKTKERKYI